MKFKQNTVDFHPQAEAIKKAYDDAQKQRAERYRDLFKELGLNPSKEDIIPRPLIYCLPTGNAEFDAGFDAATPGKDRIYGIHGGGFPVGRVTILSGRSGVGKSQFVYNLCRNAAFRTLYVDSEGGIIDTQSDNVFVYNTEILEDCWTIVMRAIESGKFNCIVIDSLTNLKTRDDMQKDDGEGPRMGQRAQVMNNFLVKLTAKLMSNEVAVVVISQERESMDLFKKDPVLPGGASVLYSSSVIMGLMSNKSEEIKDKETGLKVGQKTRVRLRKNRFGADNCEFTCKIMFQEPNGGIKKK